MQVKYADSGGQPADWKLFIGMLPRTATEEDLRPIFMRFGNIAEVAVIRGPAGDSKGYGFVRYHFQQEAQAAINALNGAFQMDGAPGPLIVKFADAGTKRRVCYHILTQDAHLRLGTGRRGNGTWYGR